MQIQDLTKSMRWHVADCLAAERLEKVNAMSAPVHPSTTLYARFGKRAIDLVVSTLALIITFPINLVIGIVTLFDVGMPIFFHQERLGRDGKIFTITKFRNMRNTRDERGELLPPAQRVTRFGRFVRKTSLDELLNLWSIFKGDMSIIGPRPLVPEYASRYSQRHAMRMAVRPGLECPPRANLHHVWTWQEQFENDVWYVEHVSLRTDVHMLIQLVRFTLDRKSAEARAVASRGPFTGYNEEGIAISLDDVPMETIEACLKSYQPEAATSK